MTTTIGERVWQVSQEQFVAAWTSAASLDEAAAAIRALVGGPAPRWAVLARAGDLRKGGVNLKPLPASVKPAA